MTFTDRTTGRRYQLLKITDPAGAYMNAATKIRYRLVKRYR